MALALIVGTVMAGLAAFGLYRTIQQMPVQEVAVLGQPMVVATQRLPVGTLVSARDVKTVTWPLDSPVPGGFSREEDVVDRGLMASVVQNEPFTESKLAPREAGAGLPPSIPLGLRAISIRVNDVVGVAGFTVPGTRVDVLVTVAQGQDAIARIVVSNVQVLTAGTRYDLDAARENATPIPTSVVTLQVTPSDAERIALASNQGSILLVLRNPLDTLPTETNGVRLMALMGPPAPAPVTRRVNRRPVVVAPPPPTVYTVEAIRAARRSEEVVR